ncbi:hypothetical protein EDF60_1675 [Leucobacter luti]|nr:hypothetical protein EDF60_1675 [Leucobacter luti]
MRHRVGCALCVVVVQCGEDVVVGCPRESDGLAGSASMGKLSAADKQEREVIKMAPQDDDLLDLEFEEQWGHLGEGVLREMRNAD